MLRKLSVAVGLSFFLSYAGFAQSTGELDYRQLGAPLPTIRIVDETGRVSTNKDVAAGENLFIVLFNPTCDHCQDAARMFGKNESLFKDGQLYFMAAPGMLPHLDFFANTTHYKKHPVIRVGVDSAAFIEKTFNYQSLPELLIYDRSRRLVRTMSSIIALDSVRPYLGPMARQFGGPVAVPASSPLPVKSPADRPKRKKRNR